MAVFPWQKQVKEIVNTNDLEYVYGTTHSGDLVKISADKFIAQVEHIMNNNLASAFMEVHSRVESLEGIVQSLIQETSKTVPILETEVEIREYPTNKLFLNSKKELLIKIKNQVIKL